MRHQGNHELHEVNGHWRETGGVTREYDAQPRCFVRQFRLEDERPSVARGEQSGFVEIINRERDCPSFEPWKQGYSPKEHREMVNDRTLQKEIEERRQADAAWRAEERRKDEERHRRREADDRNWQLKQKAADRRWGVVSTFISLIGGAILGGLIQLAHWLFSGVK